MEKLTNQEILASGLLFYKLDMEDIMAVLIMLNSEEKVEKMLNWMKENLQTNKKEILNQSREIALGD